MLMNKNALLEALQKLFFNYLYHPNLKDDIVGLIAKSGFENQFIKTFVQLMAEYKALGRAQAERRPKSKFEPFDETLFSLHVNGKDFNIRILYAYTGADERLTFLHAFWERDASDYKKAVLIAYERLYELEKEESQ